jgi:hypothetical protein
MATERENYQTALEAASKELADFYKDGKSKPEVNGPVSVKWDSYETRLLNRIEWLRTQIAQCEGGYEIVSEADT